MRFAYIVNSGTSNLYLDMTVLSSVSLRITNPTAEVVWLCDQDTERSAKQTIARFQNLVDEIIVIQTPCKDSTFRNRWIKTQLPKFSPMDTLYLDSDTLVRKEILVSDFDGYDFAAVTNHNAEIVADQIWDEDQKFMDAMRWGRDFSFYINGGVWFYRFGSRTHELFEQWHLLWKAGVDRTGRLRDQPSLNLSLYSSNANIGLLPREFNEQIQKTNFDFTFSSKVWHFYSTASIDRYGYKQLLDSCISDKPKEIFARVTAFINCSAPWKNQDFLSRSFFGRKDPNRLFSYELLWLSGKRRLATKEFLKCLYFLPAYFYCKLFGREKVVDRWR